MAVPTTIALVVVQEPVPKKSLCGVRGEPVLMADEKGAVAFEGREALSEPFSYRVWLSIPGAAAESLDASTVMLQPARLALLLSRERPDVVVVGKAVTMLGMLGREFVFVFHEGASGYVGITREFHRSLKELWFQ